MAHSTSLLTPFRPLFLRALSALLIGLVIALEVGHSGRVSHSLLNVSLVAITLLFSARWVTPVVAVIATALSLHDLWFANSAGLGFSHEFDIYLGLGLVWVAAGLVQHRKRTDAEKSLFLQRARQQQAAVVELATDPAVIEGDIQQTARRASEILAAHLRVARASVWFLSDSRQELRCLDLFEAPHGKHSTGTVLKAADYPRYFAALESGRAIDAHDARTDERTSEYTPGYLIPLGITSMLDAGIRVAGRNLGVVCCEHIGPQREWAADEIAFAGEIADQIAQAVANEDSRRAHEAVTANERKYRDLVETSNDLIWSVDNEGCWSFVNRNAAERIYGYTPEEMIGRAFNAFVAVDRARRDSAAFERVKNGEPLSAYETVHLRKDGRPVHLSFNSIVLRDDRGRVIGATGTAADITERKEAESRRKALEEQLQHSQKMEALGRLAGGIAHDFNNLLGAIMMNAELASAALPNGSPEGRHTETIVKAAQRGKSLVAQILTFSRRVKPSYELLSVGGLVGEIEQLIRATLPQNVIFNAAIVGEPFVTGDPGQLSQVIMNLCSNAVYAMKAKGGVLQLEVEVLEAGRVPVDRLGKIPAADVVRLRVSDTGEGIPPKVREQIFEPFFSTKPIGQGTGLGLAVVLGIVEAHGGHIHLESELGLGTTFEVYFPAVQGKAQRVESAAPAARINGSEHVVIVDDESMVLEVSAAALQQYGYTVSAFVSPEEAVRAFEIDGFNADMLVTDLTMPRITGLDLARRWSARLPGRPVILCSGYDLTRQGEKIEAGLIAVQISKPYSVMELLKLVRETLNTRSEPPHVVNG